MAGVRAGGYAQEVVALEDNVFTLPEGIESVVVWVDDVASPTFAEPRIQIAEVELVGR